MTKRQTRKAAYKRIVEGNETHQAVFEDLKSQSSVKGEELATLLSKIPSKSKIAENQLLRGIFIAAMSVVIVVRVISIIALGNLMEANQAMLLLLVAIGIIFPAWGIYAAVKHQAEVYRSIALLLVIGILRGAKDLDFSDPLIMVALIPAAVGIVIGFLMPSRLKVDYKWTVSERIQPDGTLVKTRQVVFEDGPTGHAGILDL